MKKAAAKHIWYKNKHLEVCEQCYWLIQRLNKDMEKPVGRPKKQ